MTDKIYKKENMGPALYIVTVLLSIIAFGFWLTKSPLMVLGLLLIPPVLQAIPWMLAVANQGRDDDDEDGPPKIGFLAEHND